MRDANLAQWIESEAAGEAIEAVSIGSVGGSDYGDDREDRSKPHHEPMPWSEARPLLDYSFDSGFGGADCNAITAWTASRVIFVSQYDGATSINHVPRNPCAHAPAMPGGG